jgi:hypothetical protein
MGHRNAFDSVSRRAWGGQRLSIRRDAQAGARETALCPPLGGTSLPEGGFSQNINVTVIK